MGGERFLGGFLFSMRKGEPEKVAGNGFRRR